ncbi:hypothetical protein LX15_004055 [Streptoalloteichus tenebrarius]|uniref:Uncharacterized protein n=1 Tax=Streptoalloteichus tenebrarius (strain ATCC 17920 / DSM 40477 / JCM 4838 / CBS 697.72 / NBRC 16177 / NCIMB 11028 / NRRL B-12390 / A12253. 1 / ISP 5477) TaxID=1933 RepID=A0ABT1HXU8_STRSD|nr:hypothetical protein [Streptoalloteichus tenebrarius]MCP2260342.1 hypothetical protein [Streptoalloteichus tenebrarius]BFF03094.1 hypothetical protein GCM10020241_47690 [Streptoalloteichus tenebrarius]
MGRAFFVDHAGCDVSVSAGARKLESLLEAVPALESLGRRAQEDDEEDALVAAAELQDRYARWYAEALAVIPDDLTARFRGLYLRRYAYPKIQHFVRSPRQRWALYDHVPRFFKERGPWQYALNDSFLAPLQEQKQLLLQALARCEPAASAFPGFDLLQRIAVRLPEAIAILTRENRERPGAPIRDEYDLQRILHAVLSVFFDDVRAEETTPSRAGGSYRIDFLLTSEKVAVEVKMTRESMTTRQVRDQLVADIFGYRRHPDVSAFFAIVYDPGRLMDNPRGFENDFRDDDPDFPVRVVVVGA